MKNKLPFVSVIVATYNREELLCNTITQLKKQNFPKYEINIVDQTKNHSPQTLRFLENNKKSINYFRLNRANLCYARNSGIKNSKGEIIIFLDDDVRIKDDFIFHHAKNYNDASIVSVVGQVLDSKHPKSKDVPPISKLIFFGKEKVNLHSNQKGIIKFGRGCNMSFRKELFNRIGKFDENLAIKDELDLYMRINKIEDYVVFEPKASIYHFEAKSGGTAEIKQRSKQESLNKKIRKLARDETIFHMKHFNIYTLLLYFLFLNFRYALKWNFPHPGKILKGALATFRGVRQGLKIYFESY